jgi:adenylyl- and sulfurtransferase ThiI
MTKAIGLLSGGLDSTLAVKLMLNQGIEVVALNFITPFCTCTKKGCRHEASRITKKFEIKIKIIAANDEYIKMVRNPKHGYGKNMNPCIDCRIFMLKKAKEYMGEIGGLFIYRRGSGPTPDVSTEGGDDSHRERSWSGRFDTETAFCSILGAHNSGKRRIGR